MFEAVEEKVVILGALDQLQDNRQVVLDVARGRQAHRSASLQLDPLAFGLAGHNLHECLEVIGVSFGPQTPYHKLFGE